MKYGNKRTWSELCGRMFDSKLEATRGEQLVLLQMDGAISNLRYQIRLVLSESPRVAVVVDFQYTDHGARPVLNRIIHEDAKGVLTPTARVKYAWLKQKYGIDVVLWRG